MSEPMQSDSIHNVESNPIYSLKSPWEKQKHNIWLATNLTLMRNLAHFPFPNMLERQRGEQLLTLIFDAMKESLLLQNPQLLHADKLTPAEREYLLEHFLAPNSLYKAHGSEGFIIDLTGTFFAVLNLNNHLELNILNIDQEIERTWNELVRIEALIGKRVDFSYSDRFGFLTADPKQCGTGFLVTLYLHIPAIIHSGELPELLEKERDEEVNALGLQGSATEMVGDILVAQNNCTLGLTEEYILTTMRMWATRATVAEITLRKKLMQNNHEMIKNKVTRALGLLTHSYQLETIEALNALSLVKLGIEIGWIVAPESVNMNQFLFNCRRAHLLKIIGGNVSIPSLPKKRAEYYHDIAKTLKLNI